jgi:hypothetical protein
MSTSNSSSHVGIGGLAFLAGVLATILTAYAVVTRRDRKVSGVRPVYEGWDDSLGV